MTDLIRFFGLLGLIAGLLAQIAQASPHYSRTYQVSCNACHSQGSRLNTSGYRFAETGRFDHWQQTVIDTGDPAARPTRLFPVSIFSRLGFHYQQAGQISGASDNTSVRQTTTDFHGPDLVRVLISTPLTRRTGYQLDADFTLTNASPGNIWVRTGHDSRVRFTLGRYDLAALLINPRTMLHPSRPALYSLSTLDFDHGARIDLDIGFSTVTVGLSNGKSMATTSNSAGPGNTRTLLDLDNNKRWFALLNLGITEQFFGLFASRGKFPSATGTYAELLDGPARTRTSTGMQAQKQLGQHIRLVVQLIANQWDNFLGDQRNRRWYGGFATLEFSTMTGLGWSIRYQTLHAGDLRNTGSYWEGLDQHLITSSFSWQQSASVRLRLDLNLDMKAIDRRQPYTRHSQKNNHLFAGIELSI